MRPLLRLSCLASALIALPLAAEPADVVREFFARYAASDVAGASQLWVEGVPAEGFLRAHRRRLERRCLRLASLDVSASPADPAIVETSETFFVQRWIETSASRFRLQRDGSGWRIAAWERREAELVEPIVQAPSLGAAMEILAARPELHTTTLVRLLSRRVVDLVNQRKFDAAAIGGLVAQSLAERLGDPAAMADAASARSVLARVNSQLDIDVAYDLARESVLLAEGAGDPDVLARALLRLERCIEILEALPELEMLQRGVALADELEDPAIAAMTATHLSRAYELRGKFLQAFRYAELAARFADESGDPAARISAELIVGAAYMWIGEHVLAERHYRRAGDLSRQAGFPGIAAHTLSSLIILADNQGRPEEALRLLEQGLREITDAKLRAGLLLGRADRHRVAGRLDDARRDVERSLELAPPEPLTRPAIENMKGMIAFAAGDYETALAHHQAARAPNASDDRGARYGMAAALVCLGRPEESRRLLEDVIVEEDTTAAVDPQLQLFSSAGSAAYPLLVRVLAEQGEIHAALEVAEEMKAAALRRALTNRGMDPAELSGADREREEMLNGRIRELNRRIYAANTPPAETVVLREQLAEAQADLRDFRQRRFAFRGQGAAPAEEDKRAAGSLLDLPPQLDDTALVLYAFGDEQSFVFAIEPEKESHRRVMMRAIPMRGDELKQRIARFASVVEQRNLRSAELAAEMYELLVAPVEDALRSAKALCIIPEASLWRVPFHALGPRGGPPLVERMPVFYAPSITVLEAAQSIGRERASTRGRGLIAFANPNVDAEAASLYRTLDRDATISAIPETETEVRAIARIYGPDRSRIYVGREARESVLKREAPHHDVLHIAAHGLAHPHTPMFSSLLLGTSREDRAEDGVLEAREIAGLDLDVDLAVLSACETGKAEDTRGDGVIGLSWAFFTAGCPTTVVSQWKAQSAATAELMVEFHRHVRRGASKAEALRQAQLTLRRDRRWRHPFYWAPFIIVGAP